MCKPFTQSFSLTDYRTVETCYICGKIGVELIYRSGDLPSVNSLSEMIRNETWVYYCMACGHMQTPSIENLEEYYDSQYKILINSEDEDQLYAGSGGNQLFRTEHQIDVLLAKQKLPLGAWILDYGCGKSSTLRSLLARRPDINPCVFDVSSDYRKYWDKFIPLESQAVYEAPSAWLGKFDVVTTFYALEHVLDVTGFLKKIFSLLKEGGCIHGIVPNVFANVADIIVADHTNHFSKSSLLTALSLAGFSSVEIDGSSHASAWVFTGLKSATVEKGKAAPVDDGVREKVLEIAGFWKDGGNRVQMFAESHRGKRAAIYGSGFYGTFIAFCLENYTRPSCFLDRNPHRQGAQHLGKMICAPEDLPSDVEVVYVGLNPTYSRAAIESLTCWQDRRLEYFYL